MKGSGLVFCIRFGCFKLKKSGTGRKISSYLFVQSKQAVGHFSLDSLEVLLATHTRIVTRI